MVLAAPNPDEPVPDADLVQARLWRNMTLQDLTMTGHMRVGNRIEPLTVRSKDRTMVFEFKEGLQVRVELTSEGSDVFRRQEGQKNWQLLNGAQRQEHILNSDITYEDLGVDFLRWPNARPLGTDRIKTLSAWAYEVTAPGPSQYAKAHYWVSSDFLAVLRVDAFNQDGQVIRRVEVNGVQRFEDIYVIKEMMFATIIPGRNLAQSRTIINLREVSRGSGL